MSSQSGRRGSGRRSGRRYYSRPRTCQFCSDPELKIHYRNTQLLSNFVNREGKIRPRRPVRATAIPANSATISGRW